MISTKDEICLALPQMPRGRRTQETRNIRREFAEQVLKLRSTVDFSFSSRGWCYTSEKFGLLKSDFDKFQALMGDMRENGELPLNITSEDKSREFWCDEQVGYSDATDEAAWIKEQVGSVIDSWTPISFWDDKDVFLVIVVEKIDLVNLFLPICKKYRIPIANAKGWSDKHQRAQLILRCKPHIEAGRRVVILYCGDFDPQGLLISEKLLKNLFDLRNAFYDYSLDGGQGIVDLRINPGDIEVDRFGLNYKLIEELGLSWIDNLKSGNDKQPPLNNPEHPDFKKPYVQEYIRDYCDGYLNRSGFYTTNTPRKCEANALIANIEEGRRLCEQAILKYLDDSVVAEHEAELIERRHELRAITGDWFPGNGDHKPSRRRPRRRKGE